jgi:hypothetical protein
LPRLKSSVFEYNFRPYSSGVISCGTSLGLWSSVWSSTAEILTSDRRLKNSIEELDDRYETFFNKLVSKRFKMNMEHLTDII